MKEDSVLVGWGWRNKVPETGRLRQHRSTLSQCRCWKPQTKVSVSRAGLSARRIRLCCLCPHWVLPVYGFVS